MWTLKSYISYPWTSSTYSYSGCHKHILYKGMYSPFQVFAGISPGHGLVVPRYSFIIKKEMIALKTLNNYT